MKMIFPRNAKKNKYQNFLRKFWINLLKNICLIKFDQNVSCHLSIHKVMGKWNAFNDF